MTRSEKAAAVAALGGMFLVAAVNARAGERTDIQGMGMARTFVAASRGLDAVGINPANLGMPDDANVTFSILPLGLHVGSDFLSYGLFTTYFNGEQTDSGRVGRYLSDTDKRSILSAFPGGLGTISADMEARLFGLSLNLGSQGAVAVTVTEHVSGSAVVPSDYVRFLFYGNTPGSTYDFSNTRAVGSWTREYALSYGRPLPAFGFLESLAGGVAVKVVHGFGYYEVNRFNARLVTADDGTVAGSVDVGTRASGIDLIHDSAGHGFTPFPAPAGTGFGFDLGVTGALTDYLTAGVSVTDIGSITWARNVQSTRADTSVTISDPTQNIDGDAVDRALRGTTTKGGTFTTPLPTTLRAGVALDLHKVPFFKKLLFGELVFGCDYNQGLTNAPGTSLVPRFSMGVEYRPWGFLPLRTGLSFGGADHSNLALGLGFHLGAFALDLASDNVGWLFSPRGFSYGSAAVGMSLKF